MKTVSIISDKELEELKELSTRATQGNWWVDSHGTNFISFTSDDTEVVFSAKNYHDKAVRHPETGNLSYWRNDWDASYIATACPAKITKLINRLEAAEAKLKELNI